MDANPESEQIIFQQFSAEFLKGIRLLDT